MSFTFFPDITTSPAAHTSALLRAAGDPVDSVTVPRPRTRLAIMQHQMHCGTATRTRTCDPDLQSSNFQARMMPEPRIDSLSSRSNASVRGTTVSGVGDSAADSRSGSAASSEVQIMKDSIPAPVSVSYLHPLGSGTSAAAGLQQRQLQVQEPPPPPPRPPAPGNSNGPDAIASLILSVGPHDVAPTHAVLSHEEEDEAMSAFGIESPKDVDDHTRRVHVGMKVLPA